MSVLSLFLLTSSLTLAGPLKVAVVDTGLDLNDARLKGHLCKEGHKDFTGKGISDYNSHGTHVAGSIEKYAGDGDYCLLIYKYFLASDPGMASFHREMSAFEKAISDGATIINFSAGGPEFQEEELILIKNHPEVTFVVAAGNEGQNLDDPNNTYYPASYFLNNERVIGNWGNDNKRVKSSNYSDMVASYEYGEDVLSTAPGGKMIRLTGTSMAAAIYTGKLIRERLNAKKSLSK